MKDKIKLSIFWVTSFIIIIFIMCFRVHAEEPYFPMFQNNNGNFSDADITYIENYYNTENNYIFAYFSGYAPGYGTRMKNFQVIIIPKDHTEMIYGEALSNGYQFNIYSVGMLAGNQFDFLQILDQGWYYHYSSNINNFQNLNSSNYDSAIDYVSNFRLFSSNSENASTILKYGTDPNPPLDIGVAIVPPEPILPDYPSGTTPPAQVPPTFTAADYNWTTPPTFDSSSIENAIGSIQNTLGWIANNLKEEFKNLTNNLKGFFKYIGDTIQYYGNALISTLNNFIQNFYDNMKSLVEPIFQKLDYITTPLEADVIWDNISGTSLITNYSSIINAASSMKSSFENLSEPTEYKIPIHLENLPSSWFGNLTTQYIDLGVINPVKTILRTFMWALITYSLFVTIIDSIANYINGGGDES